MKRLGRVGKPDANHATIVAILRARGWYVISTSGMGYGCPDAFAAKDGRLVPIEIKDGSKPPSARKLTDDESKVFQAFADKGVPVTMLMSVEDAMKL